MSGDSWHVLVPSTLHPAGPTLLSEFGTVTAVDEADGYEAFDVDLAHVDAIIVRTLELDAAFFAAASNLAVVSKHGVGLDNVDLGAATDYGVLVCNVPALESNHLAVAEHALTMMLALRKRLVAADRDVKDGGWHRNAYAAPLLAGDTFGVFGLGSIGRRVTERAACLGMDLLAYDPYVASADLPPAVTRVDTTVELCQRADVISVHAPLTAETRGAIGEAELAALGPDGIVINTARGGIVDEAALVDALADDAIGGAGIDTFAEEPPDPAHPLFDFDSVLCTPHCAGASEESLRELSVQAANHVRAVYDGNLPETTVNPDAC